MILVVAYGNSLRQDDGAGLLLAEGIVAAYEAAGQPAKLFALQQLAPEVALELARPEVSQVLFVDTRVAHDETDTAVVTRQLGSAPASPSLGHQVDPEMLVLFARQLFGAGDGTPVRLMTIPGFAFGHGEGLSGRCKAILEGCLSQFRDELVKAIPHHAALSADEQNVT